MGLRPEIVPNKHYQHMRNRAILPNKEHSEASNDDRESDDVSRLKSYVL